MTRTFEDWMRRAASVAGSNSESLMRDFVKDLLYALEGSDEDDRAAALTAWHAIEEMEDDDD